MSTSSSRRAALRGAPVVASAGPRIAVIGSGYGGAVAALALARAGRQVDLIEMGADWSTMPPKADGTVFDRMDAATGRSTWFGTRTDAPFARFFGMDVVNKDIDSRAGVLDTVRFDDFKVYRGVGVGGGSIVNGGMAVTPRRSFLGQVMPSLELGEMYGTYFPRATEALGVTAPPVDVIGTSPWYQYTRRSAADVRKAGYSQVMVPNVYDWDHLRRETVERPRAPPRPPRSSTATTTASGRSTRRSSPRPSRPAGSASSRSRRSPR